MSRTVSLIALAVCLVSVAARAAMTHTITYVGAYTLGLGTGPVIDVYKVSLDAGEGRLMGALVVNIGTITGYGDDPFQAAWHSGGTTPTVNLTPTKDDADSWLTPPDATKCYEADSHFLPAGISTWVPVVVAPNETNDGSIYAPGPDDYRAGVGSLSVSISIPVSQRTRVIDVAQVGVIRGSEVWPWGMNDSMDDLGNTAGEVYFLIPEPATLGLLGAGALALLRRRR